MKESRDQLEHLLRRFYDEEQALQAASEIASAESLLAAASPLPRPEVVAELKSSLKRRAEVLAARKRFYRQILTAAAACAPIAVGLLWSGRQSHPVHSDHPVVLQTKMVEDFFSDEGVSELSSTLEDISEQLYTVSPEDKNDSWESEVDSEIEEMVLIAQADFWKG